MPTMTELDGLGGVRLSTLMKLECRFAETLRFHYGARSQLRAAVRRMTFEVIATGAPQTTAMRMVEFVAQNQISRDASDRTSLLSSEPPSTTVIRDMLDWVDAEYRQVPPPAGISTD